MVMFGPIARLSAATVLAAMVGCGPQVATNDDGTTGASATSTPETNSAATTRTAGGTTSGSTTTTGSGVTTAPPRPTTTTTTGSDESGEAEGSTGEMCSCEGVEIPFDGRTKEGLSASDLLASGSEFEIPLLWYAVADNPSTVVSISVTYAKGPIIDEPGSFEPSAQAVPTRSRCGSADTATGSLNSLAGPNSSFNLHRGLSKRPLAAEAKPPRLHPKRAPLGAY